MSRETDFKTVVEADAPTMAVLTGGVYTYASFGPEGLTRESVAAAFDENGYLQPCMIIKERAAVPDGFLDDMLNQEASVRKVIELWIYEDRNYNSIDTLMPLTKGLFHGYRFADSFPLEWAGNPITRGRDEGALKGKSMARQDWLVIDIQ